MSCNRSGDNLRYIIFFKNMSRVLGKVVFLQNLTHNPIMNHWMTKYTVIIEKNPVTGCYVGQCKQIPEAFSQGRTVEELMANMKEAVSLAIECREEDLSSECQNGEIFQQELVLA